jgi:transposase
MREAVYIDESSWSTVPVGKGWSLKGMRPVSVWEGRYRVSMTLILALIPTIGVFYCEVVIGKVNRERFCSFLKEVVRKVRELGRSNPTYCVMDNASIHKNGCVKDLFDENESVVRSFYLPPYSPFLNPCEECFCKWKMQFTKLQRQHAAFDLDTKDRTSLVMFSGRDINQDDCNIWFFHTRSFISSLKNKEPITTDRIIDHLHVGDERFAPPVDGGEGSDPYAEEIE